MVSREGMRHRLLALACCAAVLGTGCAGSRFVSQATSREGTIKFAYSQQKMFETEQGIVECKVAQDGSLSDCKKIEIEFQDK